VLTPTGGTAQGLKDLGLLDAPLSLAYDFKLLTFSVPADVSQLVLTYGSCRKAHGPESDALALVDRMIERDDQLSASFVVRLGRVRQPELDAFQACAIDHSAVSPFRINDLPAVRI
jgi:hypothetical protein